MAWYFPAGGSSSSGSGINTLPSSLFSVTGGVATFAPGAATTDFNFAYPRADITIRRVNNTIVPFFTSANTDAAPGLAFQSGIAILSSGDCMLVGPGNFLMPTGYSTLYNHPFSIVGCGANVTRLYGNATTPNTNVTFLTPSGNYLLKDLTVDWQVPGGTVISPPPTPAITGIVENCTLYTADMCDIFLSTAGPPSIFTWRDCNLNGRVNNNGTAYVNFWSCELTCARGVATYTHGNTGAGNLFAYNTTFRNEGSGDANCVNINKATAAPNHIYGGSIILTSGAGAALNVQSLTTIVNVYGTVILAGTVAGASGTAVRCTATNSKANLYGGASSGSMFDLHRQSTSPNGFIKVFGHSYTRFSGDILQGEGVASLSRVSSATRDTLQTASGNMIYNTTTNRINYWDGTAWLTLLTAPSG